MATTPQAVTRSAERHPQRAAGEGSPASLDALHPHGRVRREPRDPADRARRGVVRLRRARQPLHGRPLGAVLRKRRPRPRGARRGGRPPGEGARLLHQLELRASDGGGAGRADRGRSRPGDLNRVFFTSGGSEAVESAWKLARQYHKLTGNSNKYKIISRETAYHGTTFGALSITGINSLAQSLRAARTGRVPRAQHERLPLVGGARSALGGRPDRAHHRVPGSGHRRGRDPRAGAELGRLLRAAGRLLAARARDLRPPQRAADRRRGDLLLGPPRPLVRRGALRRGAGR